MAIRTTGNVILLLCSPSTEIDYHGGEHSGKRSLAYEI
jgi:hypothetical protein